MPDSRRAFIESKPRGLRLEAAAAYIGISARKFREKVFSGEIPKPRMLDSCRIWDTRDLDSYFDDLPIDGVGVDDWGDDDAI